MLHAPDRPSLPEKQIAFIVIILSWAIHYLKTCQTYVITAYFDQRLELSDIITPSVRKKK